MREGINKTEETENMGEEIEMIGVEIIKGAQKEAWGAFLGHKHSA